MAATQYDWLVHIPDQPNTLQSRMSNLNAHLDYNKPQVAAGRLVMSGPTLALHPENAAETPAMNGSVMVFRAGSEEEVWDIIKGNPYATTGVWDLERAAITPFKCAVRTGLQ